MAKPNLPLSLQGPCHGKTPMWAPQGRAHFCAGKKTHLPPAPAWLKRQARRKHRQRCHTYEPRRPHLRPFCINHGITWDLKTISWVLNTSGITSDLGGWQEQSPNLSKKKTEERKQIIQSSKQTTEGRPYPAICLVRVLLLSCARTKLQMWNHSSLTESSKQFPWQEWACLLYEGNQISVQITKLGCFLLNNHVTLSNIL